MKLTIAIILSLLSSTAYAQTWVPQYPAPVYTPPPPPTTYQQFGPVTYGSDGTVAQRYGNQVYVTPANPSQPQVVCSTYGTTTTCQ